jgi:hypothetical protein
MYLNRSNTQAIPARALVDTGVDLLVVRRPEVVLSVTATNVGDVQTQDLDAYPLPGRAFFATLTVRFDPRRAPSTPPSSISPERSP